MPCIMMSTQKIFRPLDFPCHVCTVSVWGNTCQTPQDIYLIPSTFTQTFFYLELSPTVMECSMPMVWMDKCTCTVSSFLIFSINIATTKLLAQGAGHKHLINYNTSVFWHQYYLHVIWREQQQIVVYIGENKCHKEMSEINLWAHQQYTAYYIRIDSNAHSPT